MQPQRLIVPLFQRRYVWNQESQWEPLWNDVVRVADRMLTEPQVKHPPHFLGAVVLQQVQNPVGLMQARTIIDGQQRLTTLQLLLDCLHAEMMRANASAPAARLEPLVTNAKPFCSNPEDRFKFGSGGFGNRGRIRSCLSIKAKQCNLLGYALD